MQSSSLPVGRRPRRAKTDVIDVEMLLRTLMAWLRGEPRVCSMVPVPSEADEEARRAHREREDVIGARRSLLNKIDGILATLGIEGYRALRRDRRVRLADLRQPDVLPLPLAALARIERLLDRLELVMTPRRRSCRRPRCARARNRSASCSGCSARRRVEAEILKEALEIATESKKRTLRSLSLPREGLR